MSDESIWDIQYYTYERDRESDDTTKKKYTPADSYIAEMEQKLASVEKERDALKEAMKKMEQRWGVDDQADLYHNYLIPALKEVDNE